MKYFLVQEDNQLIHLPNCRLEEGQRQLQEVRRIGGPPIFIQGRKQPDIFVFPVPAGASLDPCVIVDENAIVRRVLVSTTEISAHSYIAAGVVEDTFQAPRLEEAKAGITAAIRNINE